MSNPSFFPAIYVFFLPLLKGRQHYLKYFLLEFWSSSFFLNGLTPVFLGGLFRPCCLQEIIHWFFSPRTQSLLWVGSPLQSILQVWLLLKIFLSFLEEKRYIFLFIFFVIGGIYHDCPFSNFIVVLVLEDIENLLKSLSSFSYELWNLIIGKLFFVVYFLLLFTKDCEV